MPKETPKIVGIPIPASGNVSPFGVGEAAVILVTVGKGVDVGPWVSVGVGLAPPEGVSVGERVEVGVDVGLSVGVEVGAPVGVPVGVERLKAKDPQACDSKVMVPVF